MAFLSHVRFANGRRHSINPLHVSPNGSVTETGTMSDSLGTGPSTFGGTMGESGTIADTVGAALLTTNSLGSASGLDTSQVFSRDVESGNPTGFTTTFNKGWGAVQFVVGANQTIVGTLRIRLRDALNTATVVQDWTNTSTNSLASGSNNVVVNIPASTTRYLADFAVAGDEAHYVTTPGDFAVGHVTMVVGQSIATGIISPYAYDQGGTIPDLSGAITFSDRTLYLGSQYLGTPGTTWTVFSQANNPTTGAAYLNCVQQKFGVVAAFLFHCYNGARQESWQPDDWNGWWVNFILPLLNLHASQNGSGKANIDCLFWCGNNSNTDTDQASYTPPAAYAAVFGHIVMSMRELTSRDFAVLHCLSFVPDGGFGRLWVDQEVERQVIKHLPVARTFKSHHNVNGSGPYGHPNMVSRQFCSEYYYATLLAATGKSSEAPDFVSATRASGSADIYVTLSNSGSSLVSWRQVCSDGVNFTFDHSASTADQATRIMICPAGTTTNIASVYFNPSATVVVDKNTLKVTIPNTQTYSDSTAFEIYYNLYSNLTGSTTALLTDDIVEVGLPVGRPIKMTTNGIYVAPPNASALAIAITSVAGLTSSAMTAAGAKTTVAGTWSGSTIPTGIEFSINGGAYSAAADVRVWTNGTWRGTFTASTSVGAGTVQARATGTSTVTSSVAFTIVASDLPSLGVSPQLDVDPRLVGNWYSDSSRTQAITHMAMAKSYTDPTGNGNHLTTFPFSKGMRYFLDLSNAMPGLYSGKYGQDVRYAQPQTPCPGLRTVSGTLATNMHNKSFTAYFSAMKGDLNTDSVSPVLSFQYLNNGVTTGVQANLAIGMDTGAWAYLNQYNNNYTEIGHIEGNTSDTIINKMIHCVVRFDVSARTFRIKVYGGNEVTATDTGNVDLSSGAWPDYGAIGFFENQFANSFAGVIHRVVLYPNYVATDTERDALLAYGQRVYGSWNYGPAA